MMSYIYIKMLILFFLMAAAAAGGISQQNLHRLRRTPQINFTYYYYHQYPLPDVYQAKIGFEKQGSNLTQLFIQLKSLIQQVRDETAKWNVTINENTQHQYQKFVHFNIETTVSITAGFTVTIADQSTLINFLDAVISIDNAKVFWVERVRQQKLNLEIENLKAKEAALEKSSEICSQYFGMVFQEMVQFQKVDGYNETINDTEEFIDGYIEVMERIDEIQNEQLIEDQDAFFKCQIICRNPQFIEGKIKKQYHKKIDAQQAEAIVKAKKASKESVQKPLKKGKATEQQRKTKKPMNNDL